MRAGEERFLQDWYSARAVFSAEWAPSIMFVLRDGPLHYTDILSTVRSLPAADGWRSRRYVLQESILTRTLKRMTSDGVLTRVQDARAFPPSVRYSLTEAAREMLEAVVPAADWVERHPEIVARAQRTRRDTRQCSTGYIGVERRGSAPSTPLMATGRMG